jgi:Fur family ferric uptake transcriptional regulator
MVVRAMARRDSFRERAHEQFGLFLSGRGLRYTAERQAVVGVVFARHRHFEAEDLLLWARAHRPRVSRATIYRTLELLVAAGLVRQMTFGDKSAQHYEQVLGIPHHDHLVCLACGRVQEVFSADLEREQDALCARHGFVVHHHNLEVFGLCRRCQAAGATVRKRAARSSNSS